MKKQGLCKIWEGGQIRKVHYGTCASGVLLTIKGYEIGCCYFPRLILFLTRPLFWLSGDSQKQIPRAKSHKWAACRLKSWNFFHDIETQVTLRTQSHEILIQFGAQYLSHVKHGPFGVSRQKKFQGENLRDHKVSISKYLLIRQLMFCLMKLR